MRPDRQWMSEDTKIGGLISQQFVENVDKFIDFALQQSNYVSECVLIRCPRKKKRCQNQSFYDTDSVKLHLYKYGFVHNYDVWRFHGENEVDNQF